MLQRQFSKAKLYALHVLIAFVVKNICEVEGVLERVGLVSTSKALAPPPSHIKGNPALKG